MTDYIVELEGGRLLHYSVPDGVRGTVVVRQRGTLTATRRTFDEDAVINQMMRTIL